MSYMTQRRYSIVKCIAKMESPSCSGKIFESPIEPVFNERCTGLSPELLTEALQYLSNRNEEAVESCICNDMGACFKGGQCAVYLFELCKRFGLRPEVRYWTAELFQRFMAKHITELSAHVRNSLSTKSPIEWKDVETRVKNQVPLRAVSCAQLASKLSSHYTIVSLSKAKAFLTECGFRYAPVSIVQSEIRVLKTLDFCVHNATPVEFVEVLLEVLGHNDGALCVKELYGVTLKVLDVFYISREQVYSKLLVCCMARGTRQSRVALEADFMLLATAIISAAAFTYDQSSSDYVIRQLSQVTCILEENILDFSSVLIEEILSDS